MRDALPVLTQPASRDKLILAGLPASLAAALTPLAPNGVVPLAGCGELLWLRPDQWLLRLSPEGAARDALQARLAGRDITVLEAGARFVEFGVSGAAVADLLAGGCSLDFRPHAFAPGSCAQSRIEQVPVILHREALDRFTVIVERPLARYLWQWLEHSAGVPGDGRREIP